MTPPPEIRVATLVRAPRERVYDAFTRAEELDAWFTKGAKVDPRPGGEMQWRWGEALTLLKFWVEHSVRY